MYVVYICVGKDTCVVESISCAHGGTCFDSASTYLCECTAGWYGRLCELGMDKMFYILKVDELTVQYFTCSDSAP